MVGDILQPTHLLFILLVALLVLGPKRLPEVGRALGKGIRDFRGAMAGIEEHTTGLFTPDQPTQAQAAPAVSGPPATVTAPTTPTPIVRAADRPIPVAQTIVSEPDPSEYAD